MRIHTRRASRSALALTTAAAAMAALTPSASAALRTTDLRLSGVTGAPSSIQAGNAFTLRTTVTNSGSRTARAPRYFVGLTRSIRAKSTVSRLATRNLSSFRGKRRGSSSLQVRVSALSSGTYRIVICVTQSSRKARCVLGARITVTKRPTTPTPPTTTTPPAPPAPPLDQQLRTAITPAELTAHTDALDAIALRNGGNRAAGTQGYDDSAAYVLNRLAKAGYEPRIDRFAFVLFAENADPILSSSVSATYPADDYGSATYSGSGDTGTKPITPIDLGPTPTPDSAPASSNTSGCEAADFAGFTAGHIALLKRGTCTFFVKAQNAVDAGASGVIIFNEGQPGREGVLNGTLGEPLDGGALVPVIGTTAAIGEGLASGAATGRLKTDTTIEPGSSYNIVADTPTGDPAKTVVVGSHLDSVAEGAGINDNGSGSAFNLELAEQMAKLAIKPANRVRFAFWGAEEAGLIGSTEYVAGLSQEEFDQIGLNLNFDMLASPNHARFVYDGDFSDSPRPAGITALAPGSADVERAFKAFFDTEKLGTLPTGFDGRSDYKPFQDNGVPAGGLFSGAEDIKSAEEAALFGGSAGVAFDPNYHQAGDTRANLNLAGFEQMADAAAQVAYQYATAPTLPAKYTAVSATARRSGTARKAATARGEWRGNRLQR